MGQALYRTYRSKKLSEIVGQEHITQALSNALKKGLISHAYLFTGPRGVGKTSIARILAHEINNLPYEDDATHLDIIEIDAASNRRIDEIRDLRDKVHISPANATYKVYIIDEVHMLTREAFNALLKTLEEPPAHAVFILATTEVHKLPETIISRTQRFTFKPVDLTKVAEHLKSIAKQEKIKIDDAALALIAAHGEGSFRDSISLLDQMRGIGHAVTAADIETALGIAPKVLIEQLLASVEQHQGAATVQLLQQLRDQGAEASQIATQLGEILRERFIANESSIPHTQTIALLTKLLGVPASQDPAIFLQITLLDVALSDRPAAAAAPVSPPVSAATVPSAPKPATKTMPAVAATPTQVTHTPERTSRQKITPAEPAHTTPAAAPPVTAPEANPAPIAAGDDTLDAAVWPQVVNTIKKQYNTLYSILRSAEPHFAPGTITLEVSYAFHQKRLNEAKNKQLIAETVERLTGQTFQIHCVVGKGRTVDTAAMPPEGGEIVHTISNGSTEMAAVTDKPAGDNGVDYYISEAEKAAARPLDSVSDIFGGGEVLDS